MKGQLVTRAIRTPLEVREEGGKRHISGFIPYDSMSEDLGGFREVIKPGAFRKTLAEGDPCCLWSHDTKDVLGRKSAGTLTFEDREDGLYFDCDLPNTRAGSDVYETISRRDAPGVSFGFYVIKDAWTRAEGKKPKLRELMEVNLLEVSVGVAFPAYPASDSSAGTRDIFGQAGIDLDEIAGILERTGGKEHSCGGADCGAVRAAIAALERLLPEMQEPEARKGEPEESTRGKPEESTFSARERELDLLEAELLEL